MQFSTREFSTPKSFKIIKMYPSSTIRIGKIPFVETIHLETKLLFDKTNFELFPPAAGANDIESITLFYCANLKWGWKVSWWN